MLCYCVVLDYLLYIEFSSLTLRFGGGEGMTDLHILWSRLVQEMVLLELLLLPPLHFSASLSACLLCPFAAALVASALTLVSSSSSCLTQEGQQDPGRVLLLLLWWLEIALIFIVI